MRLGYLGKSDLSSVNGHSSQSQNATTNDFPKPPVGGKYEIHDAWCLFDAFGDAVLLSKIL